MNFNIKVNGRVYTPDIDPDEMLITTLRKLGFYSVKCGCDTTNCGLCTVLIDDQPYLSCSMLTVRCDNRDIYTLEGLTEESAPLRELLAAQGADQCGFCSPGLIVNTVSLKRRGLSPSLHEIREYLNGNLCRCTGYSAQTRAIKEYLEA